jgi:hypothetical protein
MPTNPNDISITAAQRTQRRLADAEGTKEPAYRRSGSGPAGEPGKEGEPGKDGSTWFSGTTVPGAGTGVDGDFYFRTITHQIYKKVAGEWIEVADVTGGKGEPGAPGEDGEDGAAGKEGPAGAAAMNGFKEPCRVATTANITTSTALNPGDTIDGVVLAENDRVLVWKQTTTSQNGIYRVAAVPARTTDADSAGELRGGTTVYIEQGTIHGDRTASITTNGSITPGTTAHEWIGSDKTAFGKAKMKIEAGKEVSNEITITHNLNIVPRMVKCVGFGSSSSGVVLSHKLIEGSLTTTQVKLVFATDTTFGVTVEIEFLWEVIAS